MAAIRQNPLAKVKGLKVNNARSRSLIEDEYQALGERLDAVREGDIFLKLQNAFSFNGMKAEQRGIRSEIGAIETGLPVLNDMFRERAREIKPYLGEVADPKELLSRAQTIVPAHLQRNA